MAETCFKSQLEIDKLEQMFVLAEKANENQILGIRKVIDEILRNSFKEKRHSSSPKEVGSLIGVTLVAVVRKLRGNYSPGSFGDDVKRFVVPELNELENLESRLCFASKKIQSMKYKELIDVFLIHRNHGLELCLDHVLDGEK